MLKSLIVLAAAACALAQPPPPPPGMGPPPRGEGSRERQPAMYGQGQQYGEGDMARMPDRGDMCPMMLLEPTNREWPCKVEYWEKDSSSNAPVQVTDEYMCLGGDMCYLGPVESEPLEGPNGWRNVLAWRYFCGPKPCSMERVDTGEMYPLEDDCMACNIGGDDTIITVNTTDYRVNFCNYTEHMMMMKENPPWVPMVCRVTTASGSSDIRSCEFPETCEMGPVYPWLEGTQNKVQMCTRAPALQVGTKENNPIKSAMMGMYEGVWTMSYALAILGHVRMEGAQSALHYVIKKMEMFEETFNRWKMNEETLGKVSMKADGPLGPLFDDIVLHLYIAAEQMVPAVDSATANNFLSGMQDAGSWLYGLVDGREKDPEPAEYMMWIKDTMEMFYKKFVMTKKTDTLMARAVMQGVHSMVMSMKKGMEMMGMNEELMMAMEDFGWALAEMWNVMTDGITMSGTTPESAAMKAWNAFQKVHLTAIMSMEPAELIEKIGYECLKPMQTIAMYGTEVRGKEMKMKFKQMYSYFAMVALNIGKRMPPGEGSKDMEMILKATFEKMQWLWFSLTGGPSGPGVSPAFQIKDIMYHMGKIRQMTMKKRDQPPPPPRPQDDGPRGEGDRDEGPMGGQQQRYGDGPMGGQDRMGGQDQRGGQGYGDRPMMGGGNGGYGDRPMMGGGNGGYGDRPMMGGGNGGYGGGNGGGNGGGQMSEFFETVKMKVQNMMEGDGDKDMQCPEMFWQKEMSKEDHMMWRMPPGAYWQPEADMEMMDSRK